MEEGAVKKLKQKRVCKTPYHKWSESEQQELINFLRDNTPIEKPTAQVYYRRFLQQTNSAMDWTVVRCKEKNLRRNFLDAKAKENSTGGGTMQVGEIIQEVPLHSELEDIFGYMELEWNTLIVETKNFECDTPADIIPHSPQAVAVNEGVMPSPQQELSPPTAINFRKGIYSRNALKDVLEVHSSFVELKKGKYSEEIKVREKELELKEKAFIFEKEKHASDEKLKMLELEMKERIALREIEMKERIEMEKLKKLENMRLS